MLTDDQRDELLIRIDERVSKLGGDMKQAKSAEGFARCQVHKTQIDAMQTSLTWARRLVVGASCLKALRHYGRILQIYFTKGVNHEVFKVLQ